MEIKTYECDIQGRHEVDEVISKRRIPVMFDHDQDDGKSKMEPYFEMKELDICDRHFKEMTASRKIIYAYGAMGYNTYTL